jgi:AcrR family transcriptional regulator
VPSSPTFALFPAPVGGSSSGGRSDRTARRPPVAAHPNALAFTIDELCHRVHALRICRSGRRRAGVTVSPGGRRAGKPTARDDIIRAARTTFGSQGYDGTSLRAVARTAGVDAALVHHYFEGKPGLFIAALALPLDLRPLPPDPGQASPPHDGSGAAVVAGFLTMWDGTEGTGSSFVSCLGAMAASPAVADALRRFVLDYVGRQITPVDGENEDGADTRRALVASQLMGLASARYVLRVPPLSTASPSEIGNWVGPTLERCGKAVLD